MSGLANFLQHSEKKLVREGYFEQRMGIIPMTLNQIDHYALGRTLQHAPLYTITYTKTIHKALNTVSVNHIWNIGQPICPICQADIEDWKDIVRYTNTYQESVRELSIAGFKIVLERRKTYPPLMEFLIEYIQQHNFCTPRNH